METGWDRAPQTPPLPSVTAKGESWSWGPRRGREVTAGGWALFLNKGPLVAHYHLRELCQEPEVGCGERGRPRRE